MDNGFLFFSLPLVLGCTADFIFGDPPRFPNPVRFFGAVILRAEGLLNRGTARTVSGAFFALIFIAGVYWIFSVFQSVALSAGWGAQAVFSSVFVFFGLAGSSLIAECGAVFSAVEKDELALARERLSMIVGRDTGGLCAQKIKTAALETMSENLSDGVVAPIFFYLLGGVPAMMAYKAVNTMDSMIGYKNDRFGKFGFAAARIDDAANFIPARLTALMMAICAPSRRGFVFISRFGRSHPSPNAGFPQAALAGILDCRFGGESSYGGAKTAKPFIGETARELSPADYKTAKRINNSVMILAACLAAFIKLLSGAAFWN